MDPIYIENTRKCPDFGDTPGLPCFFVRCDKVVNILSGYVHGSV